MAPVRGIRTVRWAVPAMLLAIACSAVLWAREERAAATSFAPAWQASVDDDTPGAASDFSFGFEIDAPDANFLQLVTFMPGAFEFSRDDEVTTGAFAGTVTAEATLGLVNGSCDSKINVEYMMYEASTDTSQTIPLYGGLEDFNGNGLVDNIDYYPTFLTTIAPNLQPIQRLYGQLLISGTWTPLTFTVFEPGAEIPLYPAFDESLGYPTVISLLDPVAPIEQSSISDFCTPLATMTELFGVSRDNPDTPGNEAGEVLHRNPSEDGSFTWTMFARSRWDADDDGIENDMDPCPYDPDPNWDPRANGSAGDADQDGIPVSCDFNDNAYSSDQDGDTWINRLDLCPTLVNQSWFFQYDSDDDGVGDECDRAPDDAPDGGLSHRHELCLTNVVTIGAGGDADSPPCPEGPDLKIPPRISTWAPGTQAVGHVASIGVSLYDPVTYDEFPGVTVDFEVTGANPTSGSCLTSNSGDCQFNYLGVNSGIDTIEVSASPAGVDVSTTMQIEWVLPPDNDDIDGAVVVDSVPFEHQQTLAGATLSEDEPEGPCLFSEQTVWFEYTPGEKEFIAASVANSDGPATVSVYEGEPLEFLGCSGYAFGRTADTGPSGIGPPANMYYAWLEAGETYYFRLSGYTFDGGGEVTFDVDFAPVGDADCDGDSDTSDALLVLQRVAFGFTPPCLAGGDVDCDGVFETVDALEILRRVAGLSALVGCG